MFVVVSFDFLYSYVWSTQNSVPTTDCEHTLIGRYTSVEKRLRHEMNHLFSWMSD